MRRPRLRRPRFRRVRRLWRRTRGVMAYTAPPAGLPIHLERTREGDYAFRVDVRTGGAIEDVARIAIRHRVNEHPHPILKEIHFCEVAGQPLEAANVYALREKVAALLESIAPGGTLPLCYFRAPAMDYELPVYEDRGRLSAPVIGGPNLRARELAEIRTHVCRYLVSAGYVSEPEEVLAGVLRPSDLSRVPPAAVFRSLDDPDVWVPTVEGVSSEGPVVGTVGYATRLLREERTRAGAGPAVQPAPSAPDVVELLRHVRSDAAGSEAVYAEMVRPEIWAAAERRSEPTGRRLVAYLTDEDATTLTLDVRRTAFGELTVALEDRGINVFSAATEEALAAVVGRHLHGEGFLRFAAEVELHAEPAPRAERLDISDIATQFDSEELADIWTSR